MGFCFRRSIRSDSSTPLVIVENQMTLTNEQCIQVAEKVWGWKKTEFSKTYPTAEPVWKDEEGRSTRDIVYAVNSWSGFGKTVEAMFGRGIAIQNILFETPNEMIEATHLAALEAIDAEGS